MAKLETVEKLVALGLVERRRSDAEEWRRRFGRAVALLRAEDRANQDAGGNCIHCGAHNGHATNCELAELLELADRTG